MSLATPLAFNSLVLVPSQGSSRRMRLELVRHALTKCAKTLEYHRIEDRSDYLGIGDSLICRGMTGGQQDRIFNAVVKLLTNLPVNLPLLEKFHVRLFAGRFIGSMRFPKTPEEITLGFPIHIAQYIIIFAALKAVGQSAGPRPHLKTLALHNLIPLPGPSMLEDAFKNTMESVENLTISVHLARSLDRQELWESFWAYYLPDYPHLTSLSLTSDQPVGYEMPGIDLSALHFPALRRLKLGGFCFDMHDRLEGFVVDHRATLASLVLEACPMWTGDGFKNKMPQRGWSQVIARLEEALTALTHLRVMAKLLWGLDTEDLPRADMILTYETSTSGYGYNRGEPVDATVEADDQRALEKFYATVDARRKSIGLAPLDR